MAARPLRVINPLGSVPWSLADRYQVDPAYLEASSERRRWADDLHHTGVVAIRDLVPSTLVDRAQAAAKVGFDRGWGVEGAKLSEGWRRSRALRDLANCAEVIDVIEFLYGRRTIPFQTLTFRVGSEQDAHADSVHFDSLPSGWMCAAWVALEDIGIEQGPVVYHDGSHDDLEARAAELAAAGLVPYEAYLARLAGTVGDTGSGTSFLASAGDVLIWSAHVIHGGARVLDRNSTRWSHVTHYFFEGCAYTTPMASGGPGPDPALRNLLTDLRDGRRVHHVIDGQRARVVHLHGGRSRICGPGEPAAISSVTRLGSAVRKAALAVRWGVARGRDAVAIRLRPW